jgi:hypothetical protein
MRAARLLVLLALAASAVPVVAQQAPAPPPDQLSLAKTVRCSFTKFAATRWVDGTPETVLGTDELNFEIDAINLKARTARVVAGRGAALVSAFVTATGLNIIEQTPGGNYILTSVFIGGREGGKFKAVHSRSLGDPTELPTPSQYAGLCEIVR